MPAMIDHPSRRLRIVIKIGGYHGFEWLNAGGDIVLATGWAFAHWEVRPRQFTAISQSFAQLHSTLTAVRSHT
jgi:hypothetical protein